MRPTMDELLAGAQQALEEVILPDLQSPFARSRARMVTRMIDYVRRTLRGQAAWLEIEVEELTDLLHASLGLFDDLTAQGVGPTWLRDQRQALARALQAEGEVQTGSDQAHQLGQLGNLAQLTGQAEPSGPAARRERLRSALDQVIVALDRLEREAPQPALREARARVRVYLKASLERELELTGTRRETVAP